MTPDPTPGTFQFSPPWVELDFDMQMAPHGLHFDWEDPVSMFAYFSVQNRGPFGQVQIGCHPDAEYWLPHGFYYSDPLNLESHVRSYSRCCYALYDTPYNPPGFPWSDVCVIVGGALVGILMAWLGKKAREKLFGGGQ